MPEGLQRSGARPRPAAPKRPRRARPQARARIRMYRQGLGDCFLVSLPRRDGPRGDFHVMIDCGVLLGTPDAAALMANVVRDIAEVTGGHVDLLVVTHEHWDHVSGFLQAEAELRSISFGAVWMGWTENRADPQVQALEKARDRTLAALRRGVSRLRLAGAAEGAAEIAGLLDFFGAAGGASTRDALDAARALAPPPGPHYAEPGEPPTELPGTAARLYVLGPPRDEEKLLRSDPSRGEAYGFGLAGFPMEDVEACLGRDTPDSPFGPRLAIPLETARGMPHFQRYWADGRAGAGEGDDWRRIDTAWLEDATGLALKLDHDTNNSSLALAIELEDGDVLLFAADAQAGNWASWQDLSWQVDGRAVTGPDLLARTILYKVGHHGSHNATLRGKGLETMARLRWAMIPVDQTVAEKRRWTAMPLPALLDRLGEKAAMGVLRSDRKAPPGMAEVTEAALHFELTL